MLTVLCLVVGYSAWSARIPRSDEAIEGGVGDDSIQAPPDGEA
jgi:hypothetical protein